MAQDGVNRQQQDVIDYRCLRCLLLVMCTYPFAKKALTLYLARGEGRERYFGCNLMQSKVLASSHQHLMAEAPVATHPRRHRFTGWVWDTLHGKSLTRRHLDNIVNRLGNEVRQSNPVAGVWNIALQARNSGFSGKRVRLRKLINGLDILLEGLEECVSVFNGDYLGSAVVNQPLGLITWLTPGRPVSREPAR